jgi:predicted transcriptional regulator
MKERLYPYVIFLPKDSKQQVLSTVFGSMVPVDILKFALKQGVSEKIFQKDLIGSLDYSNKTIIEHLKTLTELGILDEHMEKVERAGRTVWLKSYTLSDLGKWSALLIVEEKSLKREEKIEIVSNALRSYTRWIKELSEKLGVDKEVLSKIFEEEMK